MPDSTGQTMAGSAEGLVLADLEEKFRQAKNARQRFERGWVLQLAYYEGNQWIAVDTAGNLFRPALEPWQQTPVDNRILGFVTTQVAKLTKTRPTMLVVPQTQEDEDMHAAVVGESILDYEWQHLNLARKLRAALLWSRVCSAGFWKVCWDPTVGNATKVWANEEGVPLSNAGRPMKVDDPRVQEIMEGVPGAMDRLKQIEVAMGDVSVEVRTPFEIYPDPNAGEDGMESCAWVIEETIQSLESVQERFGDKADGLNVDSDASSSITSARGLAGTAMDTSVPKSGVKIREFWSKPSKTHPNGRHVVWAQNKVLLAEDNPYPWLPYVMFRGTVAPGRFWPTCVTEQLIGLQTELNKLKAQISENAARIGNPPLLESRQQGVEWSGLPGERVTYDDTTPNLPQFLQVPEMPGYIREHIGRVEASMAEIAGIADVTRGNVPTGVTAASAINLLLEQDDTRLGPDVQDVELAIADAGRRLLQLVAKYYTDTRQIRIVGDEGVWDVFDFKGSMLKGNTDVQVQAGSGMPRSKAAQQAAMTEILNLCMQYQMPLDQRTLRKFFQGYEAAGLERLFGELERDEQQTQRENRKLSMGITVTPNTWDNHQLHIEAHDEFRKTARFEALPPTVQALFEAHVQAHKAAMAPPAPPMGMPGAPVPPGMAAPEGQPQLPPPMTPPIQ